MGVLEVRGLRKTYESQEAEGAPVRALRGVDLDMEQGEFVAVMGPSGCGKSTLLNMVAGLDTPSEGQVVLAGEGLAGKDENDLARMRRKHIGIVFQFFNLLEGMSVLENVTLPAVIAGTPRKQAEVMELFRRLHGEGQSIMLVTHDDEVAAAADRIVQRRDGKIADGREPEPVASRRDSTFGSIEPGRDTAR